jgi:FAD/FMN-containing dehydrogenase
VLENKVVFPGTANFSQAIGGYYSSQEAELVPSCVVLPSSVEDVAIFVKKLSLINSNARYPACHFAVKGGGHTPTAGAANTNNGITLSMSNLKQISLNKDNSVVSLGGGALWGIVYDTLAPLGLSVAGGRNRAVGVAGFLTGGM